MVNLLVAGSDWEETNYATHVTCEPATARAPGKPYAKRNSIHETTGFSVVWFFFPNYRVIRKKPYYENDI